MNIREEIMSPDFTKFHLEGPWPFHAVMHRFTQPDHGDPHDHPWSFRSNIGFGINRILTDPGARCRGSRKEPL